MNGEGTLELKCEEWLGAARHYLAGEAVHAGDQVDLFEKGRWVEGRYEWTFEVGEAPVFCAGSHTRAIRADDVLRWPVAARARFAGV